jgi:hypothetical protein
MVKHKLLALLLSVAGISLLAVASVAAQSVTQGYLSDQTLQNGMIVRLKPGDAKKIEALKQSNAADMFGIVVSNSAAPVSLSDPTTQQTFVATFGKYNVLVSDQDGPINAGDFISVSAVDGVGMRASNDQQIVLGKAIGNFTGNGDAESKITVTDSTGAKHDINLKRIGVDISVAHNPNYSGDTTAGVPHFLSKAVQLVTRKPVTALRLYAALGVLGLSIGVAGGVIYAGVRTGMTAVGRNPLAKKAITRNLIAVIMIAIVVVLIGCIAVYLLLKI